MKPRVDFQTIAAISTAVGNGGVAVIRVSGNLARAIASKMSQRSDLQPRVACFSSFYDHQGINELDKGLLIFFEGPASFTGEDVVEFHLHGSYFLAKVFLKEILQLGAILAPAGEFTKRAFLNGKIDLAQAEAVAEMIAADSEKSLQLAKGHLAGNISQQIKIYRENLLSIITEIEAGIDYPDELSEPDTKKILETLTALQQDLVNLSKSFNKGKMIKEGLRVVLVGKPNVGKSSLLNLLLKDQRAIVTAIPGTTRDFIEEKITINGLTVIISDTAGLHHTNDQVEKIGIEQSKQQIEQADLCLLVVDPQQGIDQQDQLIFELIKNKQHIIVINKCDLKIDINIAWESPLSYISATTGSGEAELIQKITDLIEIDQINPDKELYLSSIRQKNNVDNCLKALATTIQTIQGNYLDLATVPLRQALEELSYITKEEISDEIMESIWSKFCVGK